MCSIYIIPDPLCMLREVPFVPKMHIQNLIINRRTVAHRTPNWITTRQLPLPSVFVDRSWKVSAEWSVLFFLSKSCLTSSHSYARSPLRFLLSAATRLWRKACQLSSVAALCEEILRRGSHPKEYQLTLFNLRAENILSVFIPWIDPQQSHELRW